MYSVPRVFNAITKTVGQFLSPAMSNSVVSWNFLVESLSKVVRTVLLCMETESVDEELIVTGTVSRGLSSSNYLEFRVSHKT